MIINEQMNRNLLEVVSMQLLHNFRCHPKKTFPRHGQIIYKICNAMSFTTLQITASRIACAKKETYQQGVPTKVFLERCLSPVSNIHADTPKSANFTDPLKSTNMFPA